MVQCVACKEENPPKFRLCGYCGAPLPQAAPAAPPREVRKTVTLIFCDLKGSTALGEVLDAEALHEVKERYFAAMAAEITRHAGKIEKYIGDAIMAVFGLPRAHEDDALRAVRAAQGMQQALAQLNVELQARYGVSLANRTGVNTGQVVANDDPTADQKLATGDAVNVCARLEQAAPENQIYLGEVTYRLVRDAVEAEPVEPLELKGKAQRVPAYRLVSARGLEGLARRHDKPIVGRDEELAALRGVYADVVSQRRPRLVTVVGDAGAGKTRLVREVMDHVAQGGQVIAGRCLPYGHGITFWPLLMMIRGAAHILDADSPDEAVAKLRLCVGDDEVADRLAGAAGLATGSYPLHEINWAARKFMERLAADGPVVALFDDVHWAETALLELAAHVLDTAEAPILLLATARHDFFEQRPDWSTQERAQRIVLKPLSDEASARVVANLFGTTDLPGDVLARIVSAAGGNPLYAEQMLSMLLDNGALRREDGRWVRVQPSTDIEVPPTIQALLEARLDQLGRPERSVVDPAAVIGVEFAHAAVEQLLPEPLRPAMPDHLRSLQSKQFVHAAPRPDGDLFYRFHHHLVRETVYNGLLKRVRAQLHVAFVRWADQVNADRDRALEFEEILGYHLEQAHRYLRELGPLDEPGRAIGGDAAQRLSSAGRRAAGRGDMHAAANLLRRAVGLLDADDLRRMALLPELAETLTALGDFAGAKSAIDEALTGAERTGDRRLHASSRLTAMFVRLYSGEQHSDWSDEALHVAHELIPVLEGEGADAELATAWRLVVLVHGIAGRFSQVGEAVERSIVHARRVGNDRLVARNSVAFANMALYGPLPAPEAIARCESLIAEGIADLQCECIVLCMLAQLRAMDGSLDTARELCRRARAQLRDLGQGIFAASTGIDLARVELLGGNPASVEREIRADYEFLAEKKETYLLSTMAALLARLVRDQGRDAEALALTQAAEAASADDDPEAQALWRMVRAPLVARAGDAAQAVSMASNAVDHARSTEAPVLLADALVELGAVLLFAGQQAASEPALAEARALYEAKGNRAGVARCDEIKESGTTR
jgi:class 3 adenylate cyclase/tetratricopeptide (TPR) repeat protein